jgi:hypothetical protein
MSQAEYSRHRGLNRSSVSRLVSRGVLVMHGTRVDVAASDAVLDDRPAVDTVQTSQPAMEQTSRPSEGGPSYAQARVVDMTFRAKLRRLEFEKAQGKLVDADANRKQNSDVARTIRDGMLAIPGRLAPICAAETDQKKVESLMLQEIKRELVRIADAIDAI